MPREPRATRLTATRLLAASLLTVSLTGASGQATAAQPSALRLDPVAATAGYTGLALSGPPGATVQITETVGDSPQPLATAVLDGSGHARLSRAVAWLCDRRTRTLEAITQPPATPASANATLHTPGCGGRIILRASRRVVAGRSIYVTVRDRWAQGGLPTSLCVTAPAGAPRCRRLLLRGGNRATVRLSRAPRVGGWQVQARSRYGRASRMSWVNHGRAPLRLLAAGDSEMQILDTFIGQDAGPHGVRVTSDARISTGLTNPWFFDWIAHARRQAPALRPDVTVIFMGANDGFTVRAPDGARVGCCGPAWSAGYATLVTAMMRAYLQGSAGRVYWFLLPAPRPAGFHHVFDAVNAGIRIAAARFPGRVGLIDANAFFTPGDRFRDYMSYGGHGFTIHEADGIHLSTASDRIDAGFVLRRLRADHVLR